MPINAPLGLHLRNEPSIKLNLDNPDHRFFNKVGVQALMYFASISSKDGILIATFQILSNQLAKMGFPNVSEYISPSNRLGITAASVTQFVLNPESTCSCDGCEVKFSKTAPEYISLGWNKKWCSDICLEKDIIAGQLVIHHVDPHASPKILALYSHIPQCIPYIEVRGDKYHSFNDLAAICDEIHKTQGEGSCESDYIALSHSMTHRRNRDQAQCTKLNEALSKWITEHQNEFKFDLSVLERRRVLEYENQDKFIKAKNAVTLPKMRKSGKENYSATKKAAEIHSRRLNDGLNSQSKSAPKRKSAPRRKHTCSTKNVAAKDYTVYSASTSSVPGPTRRKPAENQDQNFTPS